MSETQVRSGCEGCIDCGRSIVSCDYLNNHGRVRPVPGRKGGGCVLKAKSYEKQAELEQKFWWDPAAAIRMKCDGIPIEEISKELGASSNALKVLFAGRADAGADPTRVKKPEVWERAEEYLALYRAGMNDVQAGKEMGIHPNTISKQRRRLGLARVPRRRKKEDAQ